jgi:hypothetical protein
MAQRTRPTRPEPDYLPLPLPADAVERAQLFGDDDRCRGQVFCVRFPDGFLCDRCDSREYSWLERYRLKCRSCGARQSLLKGTIFEQTKKKLIEWFKAIDYLRRFNVSSLQLARHFDFNPKTGWLWMQKLRTAMQGAITRSRADAPTAPEGTRLTHAQRGLEARRGGLVLDWRRESHKSHGCERLDRHDLATREQDYPWNYWISKLGSHPGDTPSTREFRKGRREASQNAIVEKHLKKYLDEFAFFFNRQGLGAWTIFRDLASSVLAAGVRPRREIVAADPLRPWLRLDDVHPLRPCAQTTRPGPQPAPAACATPARGDSRGDGEMR